MESSIGEYSEWRMIDAEPASRNGTEVVYVLVRIMLNDAGAKEGVQVGEFYEREAAEYVAQLVEDGKFIDYPDEPDSPIPPGR